MEEDSLMCGLCSSEPSYFNKRHKDCASFLYVWSSSRGVLLDGVNAEYNPEILGKESLHFGPLN